MLPLQDDAEYVVKFAEYLQLRVDELGKILHSGGKRKELDRDLADWAENFYEEMTHVG